MVAALSPLQRQFLYDSLNKPKELKLLFRASDHEFKAAAFHQKCDNIANTLVVIRTQFEKTIAGFTPYPWNQTISAWVNDSGRKSFLLQLDLLQKMVPNHDNYLIYCGTSYGPIFGDGHDIVISDSCNTNNNSNSNFPHRYNITGPNPYTNGQPSYTAFSGATANYNYKVTQYEVFQVIYN